MMFKSGLLWTALAMMLAAGCSKDKDEAAEKPAEKAPAKPLPKAANGSPLAVEFLELTGSGTDRAVKVRLYNHGDKIAAGYVVLARFFDDSGAPLKVKAGRAFENDSSFMSLSGGRYMVEPKDDRVVEIEGLSVPEKAARAELVVSRVDARSPEGGTSEAWFSQERWSEWPAEAPSEAPAE